MPAEPPWRLSWPVISGAKLIYTLGIELGGRISRATRSRELKLGCQRRTGTGTGAGQERDRSGTGMGPE